MKDPKDEHEEECEIVAQAFEEIGIPKEEITEKHVDPFKRGEDFIVYEWHAEDEENE